MVFGGGERMRRREFIRVIGLSTIWPFIAHAQLSATSPKIAKIGVLWHGASADEEKPFLDALTAALRDLGYFEGRNAQFLHRFPAEKPDQFRDLAKDLIDSKVDVIVAQTEPGAMALKQATSTIPIVFVSVPDPVGAGLVDSLARPGGNITGLSIIAKDIAGKRWGLFKEAVPTLRRVALLIDPNDANSTAAIPANLNAAKSLGLVVHVVGVPKPDAIEQTFSAIARDGFDGAVVTGAMMVDQRERVGASALAYKMPTVTGNDQAVPSGLLFSYGPDSLEFQRKAAVYVDKILKGTKPADLPVEQPTRLKLVINLRASRELGLTMPTTLLTAADEVIE
jgi:putative tryptophan/tyrosine transport system substrate-binding protein